MESDREQVRAQLREIERGEAASWVTYPPTPAWWPPACGLWTLAYALGIGLLDGLWQVASSIALAFVAGLAIHWQRRVRGSWPTGKAPREIKRLMTVFFAACGVIALAAWGVGETFGTWPAALLAAAVVTALTWWYERAYARVAAVVRERLA